MIPSYGIMCKHILFTIGVSILLQVQTATCQIAESPEIKHTLHNVGDIGNLQIIGSTDSEFSSQIAVATNSPIDDSATETEVPILGENTNNASTTATPEAVLAIRRVPSFDGLDSEALHLYSDLINALNETQKLAQEWKKFNASKAVLFIGKSGSGKTTLLQTIAGNISHLEAKELTEDSGDYYIDDGYKIHNGIESNSAVSADFITDNKTGVVFVDNPGFHDAAGAARDLEIALNMKNLAESFKYVRIALVCPHSSLKKGSYRSEFTDFLERVIDFSNNSDNHFNKLSLIATKVKNSYTMKNKKRELVPDSAEMQAIANFIDEVKVSHSNQQSSFDSNNRNRSRLIVRIARSLIAKRSRKFKNIRVFRSPEEPGPLMNQSLMMDERKSIREMLLDEDGFEPVVAGSFGVAISATTRDSIDNLFRNLNRYIVRSTEKFGMFLKNKFSDKMKSVESEHDCKIENVIAKRINDLYLIQSLKKMIGRCSNPEEFVGGISDFIKSQNLTYNTSDLENIDTRYYILKNVENLTTKNYLLSENWENALDSVEKAIENEYLYQLMLQETFLRLREYTIEKRKLPSFNNESIALNPEFEISPQNVINDLELARFASLEYNREKVEEFNRIVLKTFTRDEKFFRCNNNILVIFGKLVFISEVSDQLSSCSYVDTIVILAADTVVIDSDLNAEVLDGRNLMILAPHWVVQGKRRLVVSGKSQEGRQQKASQGMVGLDGKDGNSSGSFVGIGLYFRGIEDLTVEACGANGQDGQDGGDGKDGTDGRDEAFVQEGDEKLEHNFILYKMKKTVVIKEGQLGTAGQDSGAGGQGGKGGTKGSIKMIDLAHFGNPIQNLGHTSLECEGQPGLTGADGKPGNGGSNGCSSIIETRTHEVFVMKFDGGSEIKHPPCERFSTKGQVLRQRRLNPEIPIQRKGTLDSLVCRMFGRLRLYISDNEYYRSKLTMKLIDEFQKFMREKLCN